MKDMIATATLMFGLAACAAPAQQSEPVKSAQSAAEAPGDCPCPTPCHHQGEDKDHDAQRHREMSPMAIDDTHVEALDTDEGVKLSFTTSPENTEALRQRVHAMAERHKMHPKHGHMDHGSHMDAPNHGPMMTPPTAVDSDAGAELVFVSQDASKRDALRARVHKMAEKMQNGLACPHHHADRDDPADAGN